MGAMSCCPVRRTERELTCAASGVGSPANARIVAHDESERTQRKARLAGGLRRSRGVDLTRGRNG